MEPPHRRKVREFMAKPPFGKRNLSMDQLDMFCAALTHDSFSNESGIDVSYERLEFLGDAVIELIVCEYIFRNTEDSEGNMTQMKQEIVANKKMSSKLLERNIDIDGVLLVGNGHIEKVTGKNVLEDNMRSDSFEAVIGAFYLIYGLNETVDVVKKALL